MAREPGNTLKTATLFQIRETNRTVRQTLSSRDRTDIWKFNLGASSSFNLTLNGIAKKADVDVFLLDSRGSSIRSSRNRRNKNEKLQGISLEAGTFYVRILLQQSSGETRYNLVMSAVPVPTPTPTDQFGNSFETATLFNPAASTTTSDFVGSIDPTDFLKFTLSAPGQLNLGLTGLSADANVELYDSDRKLVTTSQNSGTANKSITQRLINYGSTYYLRIFQTPGSDTNYSLNYSFTPDTPITTASGLQYVDLVEGTGATPVKGQRIVAQYTGTLVDGTKFDSSRDRNQPFEFSLGFREVIAGWDEAFSTMKVGSRRQLIIPSSLGYGSSGTGSIPPNATLIFDVELLEIKQPTDSFGNSFETATQLAFSSSKQDFVSTLDPNDFIKFTLPVAGSINITLSELSADANLELYDTNRNPIAASTNSDLTNENIVQNLTNVGSVYYIRIFPSPGKDTTYKLSYTFTPS